MKNTTEAVLKILNDEAFLNDIKRLSDNQSQHSFQGVSMEEAYSRFLLIKQVLLNAIENGALDRVALGRRTAIHNNIDALNKSRSDINQIINLIEATYDNIEIAGLFAAGNSATNYKKELAELAKLKSEHVDFNNGYRKVKDQFIEIEDAQNDLEELIDTIEKTKANIDQNKVDSDAKIAAIQSKLQEANNIQKTLAEVEAGIGAKKEQIDTFYSKIEEYKRSIDALENQIKTIIKKDEIISDLINKAETALNLRSAEGISAAFSAQYGKASDGKLKRGWIWGAVVFLIVAILLTVWIVTGKWIDSPDSFSSIVGRIVAVAISITGATFCAKQYTNQKKIEEDYAYKATLSKSIVAFKGEIEKGEEGKKQVSEYLTRVLNEIHKDPLRYGDSKEASNTVDAIKNMLNEVMKSGKG